MKKEFIKQKYKKKIKLLNKYNKFYYDNNKALVSDKEFDILKGEILDLEKKNSYLKNKLSKENFNELY